MSVQSISNIKLSDRNFWYEEDLTCKPLSTLKDIQLFVFDPPAWRTLCKPITPHSKYAIRNSELNPDFEEISLENPESFCHFDPDSDNVTRHENQKLPKVLICHDMANGYHDDSVIDGTSKVDAYTFHNWATVDIFCYFSHHLITVPPLGWINVAHAHGVKVIGTFITEWAEGVAFWNKIFSSEAHTQDLVSWLVTIAKTLKFEGWLINIENKIAEPIKLRHFVSVLHTTLHKEIANAELIWYDSVTEDGDLSWQNKLNEKNRAFFNLCDGIFTNYSWSEQDIADSVREAADRLTDVYIGIDVWGRNFYGGGMFNTQAALKVVHHYGCSVAIFAPAWTHEAMGEGGDRRDPNAVILGANLPRYERFILRDRALWGSLWPFLKTRLPCTLPFRTSFCRGLGKKRRIYGEVLCNGPWYNLRHMQYQPNSAIGPHEYLLSTIEKIKTASRAAIPDVRGIIRFRKSFFELNKLMREEEERKRMFNEDNAVEQSIEGQKTKVELETTKSEADKLKIEADSTKTEGEADTNKIKDEQDEDPSDNKFKLEKSSTSVLQSDASKATKLKNVFRRLFSMKRKPKNSQSKELNEDNEEGTERGSLELRVTKSVSLVMSSGRSMIEAPVRFNLQYERMRLSLAYVHEERDCLKTCFDDSFNGGTCLRINPSDQVYQEHRTIRLYHCDFLVEDQLVVCMVTKVLPGFVNQWLNMWLYASTDSGAEERVRLVGRWVKGEDKGVRSLQYPLEHASADFKDLQTYLVVYEPDFYVPIHNTYGWQVFYFQVPMAHTRVTSVNLRTGHPEGAILLGHVGFCARPKR